MSYFAESAEYWRPHIVSKLIEQEALSLEDADIERCLGGCAGAIKMISMAKQMRDTGLLGNSEIRRKPYYYRIMPYMIFDVKLYAVEEPDGYILKYCDTEMDAQEHIKQL